MVLEARKKLANFSSYEWKELNEANDILFTIVVAATASDPAPMM